MGPRWGPWPRRMRLAMGTGSTYAQAMRLAWAKPCVSAASAAGFTRLACKPSSAPCAVVKASPRRQMRAPLLLNYLVQLFYISSPAGILRGGRMSLWLGVREEKMRIGERMLLPLLQHHDSEEVLLME